MDTLTKEKTIALVGFNSFHSLSSHFMSLPIFYEAFQQEDFLSFGEESMHHAFHVLRMKIGDELFVTNGAGVLIRCRVLQISKKDCQIEILETTHEAPSNAALHIAIAFTKNPARIEWFLEKATEMGVESITPLITKRSEKIHFKKDRFEKIMVSAMLQSQQYFLPKLHEATLLQDVLNGVEEIKCIAHCEKEQERSYLNEWIVVNKKTLILIGPEGDFTQEEINLCNQHRCKPVSLGPRRLRTETAGLYACAVYNSLIL